MKVRGTSDRDASVNGDDNPAPVRPAPSKLPGADRSALLEERDFLVRSLRDLEAERDAGDIDDVDYAALKDDYTARTAAILRRLNGADEAAVAAGGAEATQQHAVTGDAPTGPDPKTEAIDAAVKPARRRRRKWARWEKAVAVILVIALGGLAGWGVHRATSSRQDGQTITGSVTDPSNLETQLVAAQTDINQQKYLDALKIYRAILQVIPNQPEALTYQGWLLAIAGFVNQGMTSLNKAEKVAPTYPDAHLFRGVILIRNKHQVKAGIAELRRYLATKPPAAAATMARQAIAQAQKSQAKKG